MTCSGIICAKYLNWKKEKVFKFFNFLNYQNQSSSPLAQQTSHLPKDKYIACELYGIISKKIISWCGILPHFLWVWKIPEIGWYRGFISKLWNYFLLVYLIIFQLFMLSYFFRVIKNLKYNCLTLFWPILPFYTPWKHQKNHWFSGVFKGYKMGTVARNGLSL